MPSALLRGARRGFKIAANLATLVGESQGLHTSGCIRWEYKDRETVTWTGLNLSTADWSLQVGASDALDAGRLSVLLRACGLRG